MIKTKKYRKKGRRVPYARGFKPPSTETSRDAITYPRQDKLPIHLEPSSFQAIEPPTSPDDWLAQFNEKGQTYADFMSQCPWLSNRKWKQLKQPFVADGQNIKKKYPNGRMYLLKLGEFDSPVAPNFEDLVQYLEIFYDLPVCVLNGFNLAYSEGKFSLTYNPAASNDCAKQINSRVSQREKRILLDGRHENGHSQLKVDSVLTALKRYIPNDAFCLIALTMYDLFQAPSDLFVAGMAAGNHRVGVFSFQRYDPNCSFSSEFWYDITFKAMKDNSAAQRLVLLQSLKLLVHEVGHLLGLDHCIWYSCYMNGSGHLDEDFRQPLFSCPVDLHKIESLCGFNVIERYRKLKNFFDKRNFTDESKWLQDRIDYCTVSVYQ
jgi:archaemetzincin